MEWFLNSSDNLKPSIMFVKFPILNEFTSYFNVIQKAESQLYIKLWLNSSLKDFFFRLSGFSVCFCVCAHYLRSNDSGRCLSVKGIQCSDVSGVQKTLGQNTHTQPTQMTMLSKLSFTLLSLYIDCVSFFSSWRYCQIVSQTGHNWKGGQLFNGLSFTIDYQLGRLFIYRLEEQRGTLLCARHTVLTDARAGAHTFASIGRRLVYEWTHTHTHTQLDIPFHLNIAPVPAHSITWYTMIPTDQLKPRRDQKHTHKHCVCVASRQMVFAVGTCYSQQLWYGYQPKENTEMI